jgi:long-chain fatty acid transport protein
MKRTFRYVALAAVLLLAWANSARAAGFALYEAGTRALGFAGAYTGLANTPSTIFFNPAGLASIEGLQLEGNIALIVPSFSYDTTVPESNDALSIDAENKLFFVPSVYASFRAHDRVAVGLGVYAPFGLGVGWSNTFQNDGQTVPWWGRDIIKEIELQVVHLNASVAIKLHDRVRIGAGFVVGMGTVHLKRAVTFSNDPTDDIDVELSGSDIGFGGTAGILVNVIPKLLNIGISYRSAMSFTFEGDAAFTKDGTAAKIPAAYRQRLTDGKVEAPLTLPHTISFGLTAFPLKSERLIISLNLDIITWSQYKELAVDFVDNPELSSAERKDWNNSLQVRLGTEYLIMKENLPIRFGFIYDQTPVPDDTVGPELPDTDRYWFTFGLGYQVFGIRADLAYQFLVTAADDTDETAPIVGRRSAAAHIVSLGLGYKYDL